MPGAVKMDIEWDVNCRTESGCDWLAVYRDDIQDSNHLVFKNMPVYDGSEGRLSGRDNNQWINHTVENTEHLAFKWHSDSSNTDWGWKCTVTAHVIYEVPAIPWSKDMNSQIASLLTSITSKMLGAQPQTDTNAMKALGTPLFSGGVSNSALQSLLGLEIKMDDALCSAVKQLNKMLGRNVISFDSSGQASDLDFLVSVAHKEGDGGKVVDAVFEASRARGTGTPPTVCALFACILHHGGFAQQALEFSRDLKTVPEELKNGWERARAIHLWLAQKTQSMDKESKEQHVSC